MTSSTDGGPGVDPSAGVGNYTTTATTKNYVVKITKNKEASRWKVERRTLAYSEMAHLGVDSVHFALVSRTAIGSFRLHSCVCCVQGRQNLNSSRYANGMIYTSSLLSKSQCEYSTKSEVLSAGYRVEHVRCGALVRRALCVRVQACDGSPMS